MASSEHRRGRLIALEGVDGCGKSTQARLLAESLGALLTFEPGDTALGASIRHLMLGFEGAVSPRAEALLAASDRAQHIDELVGPALLGGHWVVTDRFNGSTLAYQGGGRELSVDALRDVLDFATGGVFADLSILLDVPLDVARRRMSSTKPDRLERQDAGFHERVVAAYRALAGAEPTAWALIDGTGTEEEVARAIAGVVAERLGRPGD